MPENRFDTSIRPNYVSNHIGLPFAELQGIAAQRQDQQNKAEEETYKLNDLVNSIPTINDPNVGLSNIAIKKTIDAKYAPRVQEVSNRIVNGGDMTALRDLNNLKREMANDPNIIEARNSALNYKAYAEDKAKKGDKYAIYKDIYRDQPLIDEQGNLKPFRYSGMGEVQDHSEEARKQMAGVKEWGYDTKNSHLEADGNIYTKDSHGKYIKDNRIRGLADEKAKDFIKTEQGKDFLQLIKYENPNATSEQLHKRVSDYLFNAGSNQIFSDFGGGTEVKETGLATFLAKKAIQDEEANKTTTSQSEALMNAPLSDLTTDMKFDSKGNLQIPEKSDKVVKQGGRDEFGVWDPNLQVTVSQKGKDLNKMAEHVRMIKDIQTNHPELQGLSPKETIETYNKARKSVSAESIPLESISNVAAKNIGEAISRNKDQRNFYVWDSKGKTDDGTLKTVLNKLDVSEEDFDKALNNGIGGYTQAGPNAGSYYVEVKDGDGNSRRVMISPDNEMKTMFRTSQMVNEIRKMVQPGTVPVGYDKDGNRVIIDIKPKIKKDGSIEWEYEKQLIDNSDNVLQREKTDLGEIRKDEKDVFKESNYLGTNTGVLKDNTTE